MAKVKVAKKATNGGRVAKANLKTKSAKPSAKAKAAPAVKSAKKPAAAAKVSAVAPKAAAKKAPAAQKAPVSAPMPAEKAATNAKAPAAPAKATAAKKPTTAAKAETPVTAKPAAAPMEKAPAPLSSPQLKLAQRVPATKLSVKVAAKIEKVAKKPKRGSRAAKLEELGIDKSNQLSQKWSSLFRKTQEVEAKPYNMRQQYEAKTPIMHKLLGWGYILTNKNDRLEVLFKDGIRFLISNYKA